MLHLTKDNFEATLAEASSLIVIDLWAQWCGPCRMLAPVIEELEAEYPSLQFAKINIDEEPELAELFHVSSIPMVALVKDNVFLDFSVGYIPKADLSQFISKYI